AAERQPVEVREVAQVSEHVEAAAAAKLEQRRRQLGAGGRRQLRGRGSEQHLAQHLVARQHRAGGERDGGLGGGALDTDDRGQRRIVARGGEVEVDLVGGGGEIDRAAVVELE